MSVYSDRGPIVRVMYLATAAAWWALRGLASRVRRQPARAVVLCYHGVTAGQQDAFAWQMSRIAGRSADMADTAARNGSRPLVCVTFDDAFANLLDHALPVMRRHGIPALVFAVAGNLGSRPGWPMPAGHPEAAEVTMTPEQLQAAANQGLCRIGSHTMTHGALADCRAQAVRFECRASKAHLEDVLGKTVEDLALPYGSHSADVMAEAAACGYRRVYTVEAHLNPLGAQGEIGRFRMSPDVWRIEFLLTCAGSYAWLHAWRRLLRRLRRRLGPALSKEPSLA